jgi:hypothetical protein
MNKQSSRIVSRLTAGSARARRTRRTALLAGLATLSVLPLGLATMTSASASTVSGSTQAAHAPATKSAPKPKPVPKPAPKPKTTTVAGRSSDVTTRVADFYGSYIDAITDAPTGGRLTTALRAFYLTPAYEKQLKAWEEREHADGVLRAQNVPEKWSVTGSGHEAKVTLNWGGNTTTRLTVVTDRHLKIISIK